MDLKSAKLIANLLIALGGIRLQQIRNVVFPLYNVLETYASQGEDIVEGELCFDTYEWKVRVEDGDPREGDLEENYYSAIEAPDGLNEDHIYECIGVRGEAPCGKTVTVLAVGGVVSYTSGTPAPDPDKINVDEIVSHALVMASEITGNPYEDTSFSDLIHDYGKYGDKEMLCGIRPRGVGGWGLFDKHCKTWANLSEGYLEAFQWLLMNTTGHAYAEAVQLRVRMGLMKVEDV